MQRRLIGFLATIFMVGTQSICAAAEPPRIVMLIGEDEYHTWETLPEFAHTDLEPRGYRVTIALEDPAKKNHFPGINEAMQNADLLILSTRRRLPPRAELDAVRAYLKRGKSLVGIRTACHAFSPKLGAMDGPHTGAVDSWAEFDPQVLGGHYVGHYDAGPKTKITAVPSTAPVPLLDSVDLKQLVGNGSLYRVNPLDASCLPILSGEISGHPAEPIAWTRSYGEHHAKIFFTSLGHPEDFKESAFRKLLANAVAWGLAKPAEREH